MAKLGPFSGTARQRLQNCLNSRLVIKTFLENGSEATLRSKTNVLSIWKWQFSGFFFFFEWMNEEVETIIWENEAKHQKVFKLKFSHSKLVKKWVKSFFELKNKHCSGVKTAYVIFYKFWLTKLNPFSGKMRQNMKLSLNQNLVMGTFCEKIAYFGFLQHFDCSSWNHLLGK